MLKRGIEVGGSCGGAGEQAAALGYRNALDHETRCAVPCHRPEELARAAGLIAPAAGRSGAACWHVFGYALVLGRLAEHTRKLDDLESAIRWLRRAADHPGAPASARRHALNVLARLHVLRVAVLEGTVLRGTVLETAGAATVLTGPQEADQAYTARLAGFAAADPGRPPRCDPG